VHLLYYDLKFSINKIYFLKQFLVKFFRNIKIINLKKSLLCLYVLKKKFTKQLNLNLLKTQNNKSSLLKIQSNKIKI